jgi:hypothetical protein
MVSLSSLGLLIMLRRRPALMELWCVHNRTQAVADQRGSDRGGVIASGLSLMGFALGYPSLAANAEGGGDGGIVVLGARGKGWYITRGQCPKLR